MILTIVKFCQKMVADFLRFPVKIVNPKNDRDGDSQSFQKYRNPEDEEDRFEDFDERERNSR